MQKYSRSEVPWCQEGWILSCPLPQKRSHRQLMAPIGLITRHSLGHMYIYGLLVKPGTGIYREIPNITHTDCSGSPNIDFEEGPGSEGRAGPKNLKLMSAIAQHVCSFPEFFQIFLTIFLLYMS